MKRPTHTKGKVIIAGAGPGDPDLITIKAAEYLRQADVILADRLVSDEILNRYASENAHIIYTSKQCGNPHSMPQSFISLLMVCYALENKKVVRLKGGDVSIFSNILDELAVLKRHQIEYEIVPGITAASGAAAYAGVPLTARAYAGGVRLLSYRTSEDYPEKYWQELAETNDTLVFYMSVGNIDTLIAKLIMNNISQEVYITVIEQATTSCQRIYNDPIYKYYLQQRNKQYLSPAIVIIGRVGALHKQYGWIANNNSDELYFKPVMPSLFPEFILKPDENVTRA